MLTILHGEDIIKSRQELEAIKNRNKDKEIVGFEGKKIDLSLLKQAIESISIFGAIRLIIIENLLTGRKNKEQERIITYIKESSLRQDIIIWEAAEISKVQLQKLFPEARIFLFKPEQMLFKLMESINPKNKKESLYLFDQCFKKESPEVIFYMLIRQFRLLLLVEDGIDDGIEEINRLSPWQKGKLAAQVGRFTKSQLLSIYHRLLEIDSNQKTGKATFDLAKTLDLFFICF